MIKENLAEIKIRMDEGNNLMGWAKNLILLAASLKLLFNLNITGGIIVGIIGIVGMYILGWLWIDKAKMLQKITELQSGKYNPYFKRTLDKLEK